MNAPLQTANTGALSRYRMMRRIRSFEERVGELFLKGGSAGSMLHLSIGEESVVGLTDAMRDGDSFTTHHRGHGIFLARGAEPGRMMAEIGGKALWTKELDQWLTEAVATADVAKRTELYGKAAARVNDNAWYVPLYNELKIAATRTSVKGYIHTPAGDRYEFISLEGEGN